jgi:Uma2 family endonuclease
MAIHVPTKPPQHAADGPPKRLFNVDEYYRMAEVGILPAEGGMELIDGVVYEGAGMRRRFTLDDLQRMVEAGILNEDERVELIGGEVVEMMAIGHRHAACVNRLTRLFVLGLGERAVVGVQNPVRLEAIDGPQPDLTIALPRGDFYASGHPTPEEILLLIEVSDSSLPYDRVTKVPLYARHGVRELWLVDLNAEVVEVYRHPSGAGYEVVQRLRRGDSVAPEALADFALTVEAILG